MDFYGNMDKWNAVDCSKDYNLRLKLINELDLKYKQGQKEEYKKQILWDVIQMEDKIRQLEEDLCTLRKELVKCKDEIEEKNGLIKLRGETILEFKGQRSVGDKQILENYKCVKELSFSNETQRAKAPAYRDNIDVQRICQMYQSGFSQSHIAKQLKCSRGTVKSRLIEKGLIK